MLTQRNYLHRAQVMHAQERTATPQTAAEVNALIDAGNRKYAAQMNLSETRITHRIGDTIREFSIPPTNLLKKREWVREALKADYGSERWNDCLYEIAKLCHIEADLTPHLDVWLKSLQATGGTWAKAGELATDAEIHAALRRAHAYNNRVTSDFVALQMDGVLPDGAVPYVSPPKANFEVRPSDAGERL